MHSRAAPPPGCRRHRIGSTLGAPPPAAHHHRGRHTTTRPSAAQPSTPDAGTLAAAPYVEEVGPTGGVTVFALGGGGSGGGGDPSTSTSTSASTPSTPARTLPAALAASLATTFLPRGFPATVTPDYLPYQLAAAPSHVAGWVSQSLVTGALLAALAAGSGVDGGGRSAPALPPPPATEASSASTETRTTATAAVTVAAAPAVAATAAAGAAAKWVTKDGLGAAGRLLVGSRLGTAIDDDPRRWRMVAEAATVRV
jgi:hypothetical protein